LNKRRLPARSAVVPAAARPQPRYRTNVQLLDENRRLLRLGQPRSVLVLSTHWARQPRFFLVFPSPGTSGVFGPGPLSLVSDATHLQLTIFTYGPGNHGSREGSPFCRRTPAFQQRSRKSHEHAARPFRRPGRYVV